MNDNTQLDTFETALLTELRREVSEHPAPALSPTPARRPRRRLRLAAIGAAGVAASVVAVFGLGSSGGAPAYAVEKNSSGDVIVTVHRLDDADGLEKALRTKGIDADVSYDANGFGPTTGIGPDGKQLPDGELPPPPDGAVGPATGSEGGDKAHVETHGELGSSTSESEPQGVKPGGPDDPCGLGGDPATLTQQGTDWVLTIPADSPLQDRHVEIGTDSTGALSVAYAGDEPNSMCGMVTVTRGAPRTE